MAGSNRPLVIIHGWSDNYQSFRRLAQLLKDRGITNDVRTISLGNYLSMDDEVTYDDIVTAMNRAWTDRKLPTDPRSVDAVVHSTGGLVIRDWLSRSFVPEKCPLYHLLMLAPANFGSPLAHKGYAFIGRLSQSYKSDRAFQTGEKILKGLELASPYAWQLALRDRFGKTVYYDRQRILCTVLVGNKGYTGIYAAANEDGTDGTVRASSANMNCVLLDGDFCTDPLRPRKTAVPSRGRTAFAVMDGENHSTIAAKEKGPANERTLDFMVRALTVEDNAFYTFCAELQTHTDGVMQTGKDTTYTHGFQNTVFLLQDQYGNRIRDYFIEFTVTDDDQHWFTELFQTDIINTTHAYKDDPSFRSMQIDCTALETALENFKNTLDVRLVAMPELRRNKRVGYRTFSKDDLGSIRLTPTDIRILFQQNRTALVRLVIRREQTGEVFEFKDA